MTMENNQTKSLITAGRILLATYFLLPGILKFVGWEQSIALMEHHNMPMANILLPIAAVAQIIGALFLLANRQVFLISLGFVAYIIVINATLHDFWNFEGTEGQHELQSFLKNLGILAGLLVFAGFSPKPNFLSK